MTTITLPSIPAPLTWLNEPLSAEPEADNQLRIVAGPNTDWFADPAGSAAKTTAPVLLFAPADDSFLFSAQVTVEFAATFDAGVLFIHERNDLWAKLCFEYSPQHQPMIVSVVTRGASDDCNSAVMHTNTIYLRIYRRADAFAFHYSQDNHQWHLVRHFTLGRPANLCIGLSAQSPTGPGCRVLFSEISYRPAMLADLRNGE
jgi:regulation of enolase protein 1 (concanavalin A-like superfamily)